jgi:Flp pilus assembly protein TadG
MRRVLARLRREERGSVLVITAGALVAMIGMLAFVVDVGSWDQVHRQAQAAADAAALAGARDLPSSQTTATTDATSYTTKNLPGAASAVTFPASTQIKVVVSKTAPSFFGKLFGITSAEVTATAVASESSGVLASCTSAGSSCYAMFAMDTSCSGDPITLGGGSHVTGGVWSNGSINVGGGGSSLGATSYSNASGCTISPGSWAQNSNSFVSGPTASAPLTSWPINYALDFPACSGASCTGPGGTPSFCTQETTATSLYLHTYNPSNLSTNNIYCGVGTGTASTPTTWNAALEVAGGPTTDTFVGGSVKIDGGTTVTACGYTTSGYSSSGCSTSVPTPVTTNYPMAYAVDAGTAIDDSSGGNTFLGDLFAPNGTIDIGGGSWTTFAEGFDVMAPGGGFSVTGDGPSTTGALTATSAASLTQ